jgi:hypothetical protein
MRSGHACRVTGCASDEWWRSCQARRQESKCAALRCEARRANDGVFCQVACEFLLEVVLSIFLGLGFVTRKPPQSDDEQGKNYC